MAKKETDGERLDRWKREAEQGAAEELYKLDRKFENWGEQLSVQQRFEVYNSLINSFKAGHARGRVEIGK